MRIIVLDGKALNPGDLSWASVGALGELEVYDRTLEADILSRIDGAQIVLTNKTPITAETIRNAPGLRYVGVLATGYNVVDVAAAAAAGVVVTNIPAYSTNEVAQYVFALLLEICHSVGEHNAAVHNGEWVRCEEFSFWKHPLISLSGKKMGIIGYGQIGKAVARLAAAFSMEVLVNSRTRVDGDGIRFVELDTLLAEADVVTLHCPLTEATAGLINSRTLTIMKESAILINTSRGGVIVEQDLADALNSGSIHAAAVDVVSREPMLADNPLLKAKNILITPHIAWASYECRERLIGIAADNIRAFIDGKPINTV